MPPMLETPRLLRPVRPSDAEVFLAIPIVVEQVRARSLAIRAEREQLIAEIAAASSPAPASYA